MFWHHLFSILINNPAVFVHYISVCAHNKHFLEYREIVRDEIEAQLAVFLTQQQDVASSPVVVDATVSIR